MTTYIVKWLYTIDYNDYIQMTTNDYIQLIIYIVKWLYTNDYIHSQMTIYNWLYIVKWLYTIDDYT